MRNVAMSVGSVSAAAVLAVSLSTSAPAADGAPVAAAADVQATAGAWSAPFTPAGGDPRVIGVHSVMLHTGKVLMFGNLSPTVGYVYDPVTGAATAANPPVDIECGAVTPLEDGRILVVGGHGRGATGISNILLFDPISATWTPQPPSPLGRYYPTTTRLADGRVLISGGFTSTGADNRNVEVYTPPPVGNSLGSLELVGSHLGSLYPNQWLLPDGRVMEAQSGSASVLDPATWKWTPLPRPQAKHYSGKAAVLLPGPVSGSTRVMMIGGGNPTTTVSATEVFDNARPVAGWTPLAPLPQPRAHMSSVLLPDGTVLGVGGNSMKNFEQPQFTALRFDPGTNVWTSLAAQVKRRGYHSSAVLLPDGRVLSAGDTGPAGGLDTSEIYSPPYLFHGARPSISAAPSQVSHGASFTIRTADVQGRVVLVSPGASTHTTDMSERHVELQVTARAGALTATAPSGTVAPTGWYMMFLVDGAGTPSTASWIHVG